MDLIQYYKIEHDLNYFKSLIDDNKMYPEDIEDMIYSEDLEDIEVIQLVIIMRLNRR